MKQISPLLLRPQNIYGRSNMNTVFILSFIVIISIYFLYPIFLIIARRFIAFKVVKKNIYPKVSLIIPAHNEEVVIAKKVSNLKSLKYDTSKLEIIMVLDGCTDNTENIIRNDFPEILVLKNKKKRGKTYSLNKAIEISQGEIIIFNDADIFLKDDAVEKIISNFNNNKVGCVAGRLVYFTEKDDNTITQKGENLYWKYEVYLRTLESDTGYLTVVSGAFYAARKDVLEKIPLDVSDDLYNPIKIVNKGYNVIFDKEAVAYAKSPENVSEELMQKIRMVNQGFKVVKRCWLDIYRTNLLFIIAVLFHKLLRWMVFIFLVSIFISNIFLLHEFFYLILSILQVIFYALAAMGYCFDKKNIKLPYFILVPYYFCVINIAAAKGFWRFLIRTETATWIKAQTTR